MKKQYLLLVSLTLITFSGCTARHWVHDTKNDQQFHSDNAVCMNMAHMGEDIEYKIPKKTGDKLTDMKNEQKIEMHVNSIKNKRRRIFDSCMYGKGWRYEKEVED
jgi:peptidoglycan hydrolase CwlO-like protein